MAKEPTANKSVRLPVSLWTRIAARAEEKGISSNEWLRRAAKAGLDGIAAPATDKSLRRDTGAAWGFNARGRK